MQDAEPKTDPPSEYFIGHPMGINNFPIGVCLPVSKAMLRPCP